MAKLFNLEVVAEGVENSIQLECIQDNKTDLYQGYLFSKPIEEISFIEMLKEQRTTKE
jgi:EAL domain-containing protein (putative c-di-GMP-specific phosphodiesterase class I)